MCVFYVDNPLVAQENVELFFMDCFLCFSDNQEKGFTELLAQLNVFLRSPLFVYFQNSSQKDVKVIP